VRGFFLCRLRFSSLFLLQRTALSPLYMSASDPPLFAGLWCSLHSLPFLNVDRPFFKLNPFTGSFVLKHLAFLMGARSFPFFEFAVGSVRSFWANLSRDCFLLPRYSPPTQEFHSVFKKNRPLPPYPACLSVASSIPAEVSPFLDGLKVPSFNPSCRNGFRSFFFACTWPLSIAAFPFPLFHDRKGVFF